MRRYENGDSDLSALAFFLLMFWLCSCATVPSERSPVTPDQQIDIQLMMTDENNRDAYVNDKKKERGIGVDDAE